MRGVGAGRGVGTGVEVEVDLGQRVDAGGRDAVAGEGGTDDAATLGAGGEGIGDLDAGAVVDQGLREVAGAFEVQLVDRVPAALHDIAVDAILTESRELAIPR